MINKSKFEYMKNYVDKIEQSVLDEHGLDRNMLFETLHEYYKAVTEG